MDGLEKFDGFLQKNVSINQDELLRLNGDILWALLCLMEKCDKSKQQVNIEIDKK